MADNNRNWNNQYQQSNNDWDQNRNRFEDEDNDRDHNRYRNTGSNNDHHNQSMRGGWNNSGSDNNWNQRQNEPRNTGSYSSDYGYQDQGYDQTNWGDSNNNRNWQNTGNQSQQWRENDQRWRNQDDNYGQDEWKRNVGNSNEYGNRRKAGSDYNQDWNRQGYSSNSGNRDSYNDRYRNTGYGESTGMTGGYSNRDNRRNNDNWNSNNRRSEGDRGWWDRTTDEVSSWFGDDDAERRRREDKMSGPHRGKGPKDYQRSEERIREDVCHRLYEDDRVDASDIKVDIQKDEVILSGTVNSREEKRRAEDVVESIYGVRNVENRIRVSRNDSDRFDRYTGTASDAGGVGRESGTTNEIIRNTGNEKHKNK